MKKIICLLLILTSLFACVSCNVLPFQKDEEPEEEIPALEVISNIINGSSPTKISSKIEYANSDETLTGIYTTLSDVKTGKKQFDFDYQRYARVEDMSDEYIKSVKGSVYYNADGSVFSSDGDSWSKQDAMGYLPESIVIDEAGFVSHKILDGGNDLEAVISESEASRIFGSDIDAVGNITLEVDTNGKYLYSVKVTYTAKSTGATVVISTSYDYSPVSLDF